MGSYSPCTSTGTVLVPGWYLQYYLQRRRRRFECDKQKAGFHRLDRREVSHFVDPFRFDREAALVRIPSHLPSTGIIELSEVTAGKRFLESAFGSRRDCRRCGAEAVLLKRSHHHRRLWSGCLPAC